MKKRAFQQRKKEMRSGENNSLKKVIFTEKLFCRSL